MFKRPPKQLSAYTLVRITDIEERHIYSDLMRKFRDEGHNVYIVTPCERRLGLQTSLTESKGVHILNVKFVLKHNPEIDSKRVEVAPNSVELREVAMEDGREKVERYYIRKKYDELVEIRRKSDPTFDGESKFFPLYRA